MVYNSTLYNCYEIRGSSPFPELNEKAPQTIEIPPVHAVTLEISHDHGTSESGLSAQEELSRSVFSKQPQFTSSLPTCRFENSDITLFAAIPETKSDPVEQLEALLQGIYREKISNIEEVSRKMSLNQSPSPRVFFRHLLSMPLEEALDKTYIKGLISPSNIVIKKSRVSNPKSLSEYLMESKVIEFNYVDINQFLFSPDDIFTTVLLAGIGKIVDREQELKWKKTVRIDKPVLNTTVDDNPNGMDREAIEELLKTRKLDFNDEHVLDDDLEENEEKSENLDGIQRIAKMLYKEDTKAMNGLLGERYDDEIISIAECFQKELLSRVKPNLLSSLFQDDILRQLYPQAPTITEVMNADGVRAFNRNQLSKKMQILFKGVLDPEYSSSFLNELKENSINAFYDNDQLATTSKSYILNDREKSNEIMRYELQAEKKYHAYKSILREGCFATLSPNTARFYDNQVMLQRKEMEQKTGLSDIACSIILVPNDANDKKVFLALIDYFRFNYSQHYVSIIMPYETVFESQLQDKSGSHIVDFIDDCINTKGVSDVNAIMNEVLNQWNIVYNLYDSTDSVMNEGNGASANSGMTKNIGFLNQGDANMLAKLELDNKNIENRHVFNSISIRDLLNRRNDIEYLATCSVLECSNHHRLFIRFTFWMKFFSFRTALSNLTLPEGITKQYIDSNARNMLSGSLPTIWLRGTTNENNIIRKYWFLCRLWYCYIALGWERSFIQELLSTENYQSQNGLKDDSYFITWEKMIKFLESRDVSLMNTPTLQKQYHLNQAAYDKENEVENNSSTTNPKLSLYDTYRTDVVVLLGKLQDIAYVRNFIFAHVEQFHPMWFSPYSRKQDSSNSVKKVLDDPVESNKNQPVASVNNQGLKLLMSNFMRGSQSCTRGREESKSPDIDLKNIVNSKENERVYCISHENNYETYAIDLDSMCSLPVSAMKSNFKHNAMKTMGDGLDDGNIELAMREASEPNATIKRGLTGIKLFFAGMNGRKGTSLEFLCKATSAISCVVNNKFIFSCRKGDKLTMLNIYDLFWKNQLNSAKYSSAVIFNSLDRRRFLIWEMPMNSYKISSRKLYRIQYDTQTLILSLNGRSKSYFSRNHAYLIVSPSPYRLKCALQSILSYSANVCAIAEHATVLEDYPLPSTVKLIRQHIEAQNPITPSLEGNRSSLYCTDEALKSQRPLGIYAAGIDEKGCNNMSRKAEQPSIFNGFPASEDKNRRDEQDYKNSRRKTNIIKAWEPMLQSLYLKPLVQQEKINGQATLHGLSIPLIETLNSGQNSYHVACACYLWSKVCSRYNNFNVVHNSMDAISPFEKVRKLTYGVHTDLLFHHKSQKNHQSSSSDLFNFPVNNEIIGFLGFSTNIHLDDNILNSVGLSPANFNIAYSILCSISNFHYIQSKNSISRRLFNEMQSEERVIHQLQTNNIGSNNKGYYIPENIDSSYFDFSSALSLLNSMKHRMPGATFCVLTTDFVDDVLFHRSHEKVEAGKVKQLSDSVPTSTLQALETSYNVFITQVTYLADESFWDVFVKTSEGTPLEDLQVFLNEGDSSQWGNELNFQKMYKIFDDFDDDEMEEEINQMYANTNRDDDLISRSSEEEGSQLFDANDSVTIIHDLSDDSGDEIAMKSKSKLLQGEDAKERNIIASERNNKNQRKRYQLGKKTSKVKRDLLKLKMLQYFKSKYDPRILMITGQPKDRIASQLALYELQRNYYKAMNEAFIVPCAELDKLEESLLRMKRATNQFIGSSLQSYDPCATAFRVFAHEAKKTQSVKQNESLNNLPASLLASKVQAKHTNEITSLLNESGVGVDMLFDVDQVTFILRLNEFSPGILYTQLPVNLSSTFINRAKGDRYDKAFNNSRFTSWISLINSMTDCHVLVLSRNNSTCARIDSFHDGQYNSFNDHRESKSYIALIGTAYNRMRARAVINWIRKPHLILSMLLPSEANRIAAEMEKLDLYYTFMNLPNNLRLVQTLLTGFVPSDLGASLCKYRSVLIPCDVKMWESNPFYQYYAVHNHVTFSSESFNRHNTKTTSFLLVSRTQGELDAAWICIGALLEKRILNVIMGGKMLDFLRLSDNKDVYENCIRELVHTQISVNASSGGVHNKPKKDYENHPSAKEVPEVSFDMFDADSNDETDSQCSQSIAMQIARLDEIYASNFPKHLEQDYPAMNYFSDDSEDDNSD